MEEIGRSVERISESLYPVLALMLAFVLYAATSVAHGSGFLAVFLAGLVVGDARLPYKAGIERFQQTGRRILATCLSRSGIGECRGSSLPLASRAVLGLRIGQVEPDVGQGCSRCEA